MADEQKTVLIVDDEADLREALKTSLEHEGYVVHTAADGEEGLSAALAQKPGLILLDIIMPKMDGTEVLEKLREDEWGKEAKVLVMTVADDLEKMADVIENGSDGYILKSDVTLQGVVKRVKEILG